jgi:hypothetical protein
VAAEAGRRIIGQVAGHTIHLEIEKVSGKKLYIKFRFHFFLFKKSMTK